MSSSGPRILWFDVGSGRREEISLPPEITVDYLGGRGLGAYLLARYLPAGTDPLSLGNLFIVGAGPLTGAPVPTSGRFSATTRSPLTGTIFDANCGGGFGTDLIGLGFDALVLVGRAAEPSCLIMGEEGIRLIPAGELWGMDIPAAAGVLETRFGKNHSRLLIGPAGENLVPLAAVESRGRFLGRGGLGAVLGSKNIKAIICKAKFSRKAADPKGFRFTAYEISKWIKAHPMTSSGLPEFGTPVLVNLIYGKGLFPIENFRRCRDPRVKNISGETLAGLTVKHRACRGCPIGCGRLIVSEGQRQEGPEYESIWALGPQTGIFDLKTIIEANHLCNRLGLDTISTGSTIGCAMELAEEGHLDLRLRFGDRKKLLTLIPQIASASGSGRLLSQGSRRLAAEAGAPNLAMQVKGLELPAYDPRGAQGQALGYATSNRGGCHLRAYMISPEIMGVPKLVDRFASRGKAGLAIVLQHLAAAQDSLILCRFLTFAVGEEYFARVLTAWTDLSFSPQDLMTAGERIWTLERLFNLREKIGPEADTLPRRFLEEPIPDGPAKGKVVELTPMLAEYYRFRGWSPDGRPEPAKISQLGLEWFNAE